MVQTIAAYSDLPSKALKPAPLCCGFPHIPAAFGCPEAADLKHNSTGIYKCVLVGFIYFDTLS
jgi:hypothetical protein